MSPRVRQFVPRLLTGAVFVLGLALFLPIAFRSGSDIGYHAEFIRKLDFVPLQFAHYYGVALLSLFSPERERILIASAVFLSVALAAKYHVSVLCTARRLGPPVTPWLWVACFGLLFVFCLPLPGQNWYLGQFPPNQWHNSTNITVMPFAVLLFFSSAAYLDSGDLRQLRWTAIWTLANGAIKPSLLMAFGPVFPLLVLARFGWGRKFLLSCIPSALVAAVGATYYLIGYIGSRYTALQTEEATVTIGWFFPWNVFSENIPLSILNSVLLPLLFLAIYPRRCIRDLHVRYAAAMLVAGLAIFSFFHETGDRALHGNFMWQALIANYLLHLSVLLAFLRIKREAPALGRGDRTLIAVFVIEVLLGGVYLARLLIHGTYI